MNIKDYIRKFFKTTGKVIGNILAAEILAALVTYFAFKSYFVLVMTICSFILFVMVPVLVSSFLAVIIFAINASEELIGWKKTIISFIVASVDLVVTRAVCLIFTRLSWSSASLEGAIMNQVIIGSFVALVIAALIDIAAYGKECLNEEAEYSDLSYKKVKLKAGIFYLTELQIFVVSIFAAVLFFPTAYFFNFNVNPLYCALALITVVFVILAVIALINGISVCIRYNYIKAHEIMREIIKQILDQQLFLSEDNIIDLCKISNPKITSRYPKLVKQILDEEKGKGKLKLIPYNGTYVYTIKDPSKLRSEYLKKISIFNKKDLAVLGIGTGLMLIKSMIAVPLTAKKLGIFKGYDPIERLDHNAKQIIKSEQSNIKKYIDNHRGMSSEARKILNTTSVPFDVTKGSRNVGINLGGANHRLATLGHDPILGIFFGVINILTNTITTNTFSTFRVVGNEIIDGNILFADVFKEALAIISENPDCLFAAIKKELEHLKSDLPTKKSLPIPGTGMLPHNFSEKIYNKHIDFFNVINAVRDVKFVVTSALVSEFINMIIETIHEVTFDPETENRELFEIRTSIIVMTADNIASIGNGLVALAKCDLRSIDFGGIFISIWRTYIASNKAFGTYWNLKKDPTEKPEIQAKIAKLNMTQLKQDVRT